MSMSEQPPEPDSSPSGEPEAEVDAGEPKRHAEPPPVPDASVSPTQDAKERWSFEVDEVLDLGAKGRFIVKDRLGRGGMGEVYRAEKVDGTAMMLELLRNDRVELAVELYPGDVQDSRSALERWWPW